MHLTFIDCAAVPTLPVWHKTRQPIFTKEFVQGFPPGLVIKTSGCACQLLQGGWGSGRAVAAPFLPNRQQSWSGLQNMHPSREYGFRRIISWGFCYSSTSYHLPEYRAVGLWSPNVYGFYKVSDIAHFLRLLLAKCCQAIESLSLLSGRVQVLRSLVEVL